jgi:adenosylhomocysteine nucleosidase
MRLPSLIVLSVLGLFALNPLRCEEMTDPAQQPCTGIMGAFSEEVTRLEEGLKDPQIHSLLGIRFVTGTLNGRKVVIASSGVGKVNAAMTATLLIDHFRPKEVIFSGIAGAVNPELRPGDIVIAQKTAQHDLGTLTAEGIQLRGARNPVDWERNPVFFEADPQLVALAQEAAKRVTLDKVRSGAEERKPSIVKGIVVTGDVFVVSSAKKEELRKSMKADAVEMEGAAVAQICRELAVPCLIIRSISDSADANARQDAAAFLDVAVRNSASLVTEILHTLALSGRPQE